MFPKSFLLCYVLPQALALSSIIIEEEKEYASKIQNNFFKSLAHNYDTDILLLDVYFRELDNKQANKETTRAILNSNIVTEYVEYLKYIGEKTLEHIEPKIKQELKLQKNVKPTINIGDIITDYKIKIQAYFDNVATRSNSFIANNDIMFLDTFDVACKLLHRKQEIIFNDAVTALKSANKFNTIDYVSSIEDIQSKKASKIFHDRIQNVTNNIYTFNTNLRKDQIKHICGKYKVCRQYPSFTDYVGHLFNEILQLSEPKFHIFTKVMIMYVKINHNFASLLLTMEENKSIASKVEKFFEDDVKNFRKICEVLRTVFTQKYNLIQIGIFKVKRSGAILRNILDFIDKSVESGFVSHFIDIFVAIRRWSDERIESIVPGLSLFTNYLSRMLTPWLGANDKNVKNIIGLYQAVHAGNITQYQELFNALLKQKI